MGISLYTAVLIQNQGENIKCAAIKNKEAKWSGQIDFWKGASLHTTLISTNFNYDSKQEAIDDMQKIIATVREANLTEEVKKIKHSEQK